MNIRILLTAACMTLAAGCSTYSSPMHNTDVVKLQSGAEVYRVQCQGLLENSNACIKAAKKICGDMAVQTVSSIEPAFADRKSEAGAREITFMCATPAAQ